MMEARVQKLEDQIANLSAQRDDLYRDLETLCVSTNGGSSWSASSVLMKRAVDAERQRDALRTEKQALESEKASLLEDMASIREAKRKSDTYCRELKARLEDSQLESQVTDRRRSTASCEKLQLQDAIEEDEFQFSDLQKLYKSEILERDEKLREAAERVQMLQDELVAFANAPDTTQLERARDEIQLLQKRIATLEESLEKTNEELEYTQADARRSEQHISTLLEQLELTQSDCGTHNANRRRAKKPRSLQKKLDRLSLDLTRAFSKIQSKDDALSETEAEMDSMKKKHRADLTLVREAFDMKFQETKKLVAQKDETIQALQHSLELMELEKKKLMCHITRRDHVLSRLRARGWNESPANKTQDVESSPEREEEVNEYRRRIDGMDAKIKMLERTLHRVTLKLEASEQHKQEALRKASGYKKKIVALRSRMKSQAESKGMPLLEANLRFHNCSTQWEDALEETRARSRSVSRPSSLRTKSRSESYSSRHSQMSLAQFALFTLTMHGIEKQQRSGQ